MKKVLLVTALVLAMSGAALAANTSSISVSANIVGACQVITGATTLDFGALDAATMSGNATATTTVQFWCTKGTAFNVTDNSDGVMDGSGTAAGDSMAYTKTSSTDYASGQGKNTTITMTINGTIAEAVWTNATPGPYADSYTVTIAP